MTALKSEQTETGWAAVVHARTLTVDFRPHLLARPHDFSTFEVDRVKKFISVALTRAEKLHDGPRWIVVKEDNFTLFGAACLFSAISEALSRDRHGRPTYGFVGYCTRLNLNLPNRTLKILNRASTFISDRWDEKQYAKNAERPTETAYAEVFLPIKPSMKGIVLSSSQSKPIVWPIEQDDQLWECASFASCPLSLCLDYPQELCAFYQYILRRS